MTATTTKPPAADEHEHTGEGEPEPRPAFKVKKFLLGPGWDVGEVHGADEFPPGTDFAGLLECGAIREMPGVAVHGGDPKVIDLLDQVEDLTRDLHLSHEAASAAANQAAATIAARDKEIADLRQELARARARALTPHAVGAEQPGHLPARPAGAPEHPTAPGESPEHPTAPPPAGAPEHPTAPPAPEPQEHKGRRGR